jgi:hypothetical protein
LGTNMDRRGGVWQPPFKLPSGNCALVNLDLRTEHVSSRYFSKSLGKSLYSMACWINASSERGAVIDTERANINGLHNSNSKSWRRSAYVYIPYMKG